VASAAVRYVDANGSNPTPPYSDWATAATNIQDAVDAAMSGDDILVTNGIYSAGGRAIDGGTSNRVAVTKPITIQSVNGPAVSVIQGYQLPGTITGEGAIRCVYLSNGAVVSGFTLTNGATRGFTGSGSNNNGGGVWCESTSEIVSNCVIIGNRSSELGGGVYGGTLNNCTIISNNAVGAGGGAGYGTLSNCTLIGNSARALGGGTYRATLDNCTLTENSARSGGGAYSGTLVSCILTNNYAKLDGGGAFDCTLNNCLLVHNTSNPMDGIAGGAELAH